MFSYDALDFTASPHARTSDDDPMSSPEMYPDPLFDFDSYVDQSFCSDFSCCGQSIPDLHRLLEHFEEEHVLPLSNDSRPLFPSPVYAQPSSSGPRASYILSYPQPHPPLRPVSPDSISRAPPDRLDFSHIPPLPELSPSPFSPTPSSSNATSSYSSPSLGEPICLPPALFTVQPSLSTPPPLRRERARTRELDSSNDKQPPPTPTPTGPRGTASGVGLQRAAKHYSGARVDPIARMPERAPGLTAPTHKERAARAKAYKCPHAGCTKSYLNPNGLKYHLEKGTCTNAAEMRLHALPLIAPAPASIIVDDDGDALENPGTASIHEGGSEDGLLSVNASGSDGDSWI